MQTPIKEYETLIDLPEDIDNEGICGIERQDINAFLLPCTNDGNSV